MLSGFAFACGRAGARVGFPCIGWDLCGLSVPSGTKGGSVHAFLPAYADVGHKGWREVECENCQWSKIKNEARVSVIVKVVLWGYPSLAQPVYK